MDPRVIAGQARTVTTLHTATGTHTLWVAPTRLGGFCYGWSKGAGGCDARGVLPLAVTWMSPDRVEPGPLPPRAFGSVEGHVHAPWADGVEIHLADGSTVQPKLTWVSKPIDAGFFYYDAHAGVSVRSVVATKNGDAVDADETGAGGVEPTPDRFVLAKEKQAVAVLETSAGRATIWVAPTKTNKICRWLELAGTHLPVTPCLPAVYGVQGLPLRYVTIDRVRLLYGAAGPRYRSVHVTFPDGHELALRPQRQFFLSEVTQPVSRLTVHATDRAGRTTTILLALAPAAP
jgi:hypothetical protein